MEHEELLKKIVKSAGIVLGGTFLAKILTFIYNIIIARIGAEVYGLFSISLAVLNVAATLSIIGFDTTIVRYISYYRGKLELGKVKGTIKYILRRTIVNGLFFAILLFILADKISIHVFHNPQLTFFLKVIAFAIPPLLIGVIYLEILRSYFYIRHWVYVKHIFESFGKVILIWIFFILGFKILGIIMSYVLVIFGTLVVSWYFIRIKVLPKLKEVQVVYPPKKELIYYSLPLMFNQLTIVIILWIDTFMISYLLDVESTGIYNIVVLVVMLMGLIPYALTYLFLPILTELHSQNKKSIFNLLYKTCTKWIFAANLVVFSLFLLISKEFINTFFGGRYVEDVLTIFDMVFPLSTVVLAILLVGFLTFYTLSCSKDILIIFKRTNFIAFNTIVVAIFNIFLNLYLIPIFGIIGAAIATSISFIVGAILIGAEAYLITKVNVFGTNYFKVLFSAVLSMVFIFIFKLLFGLIDIFSLILYPFGFILFYALFLLITKSFEREDRYIIKVLKRKMFNYMNNSKVSK